MSAAFPASPTGPITIVKSRAVQIDHLTPQRRLLKTIMAEQSTSGGGQVILTTFTSPLVIQKGDTIEIRSAEVEIKQ